jgi:hypothetical protein
MAELVGADIIGGAEFGAGSRITPVLPGEVFASPANITIVGSGPSAGTVPGDEPEYIVYEPRVRPLAKWRRKGLS